MAKHSIKIKSSSDLLEAIDRYVVKEAQDALNFSIDELTFVSLDWDTEPEPMVVLAYGEGLWKEKKSLLIDELNNLAEVLGSEDGTYPEGDRRIILIKELLRVYSEWKKEGVHIAKEPPA